MAVKQGKRRRVGLKDVASALGVSPATISNAYNRPDQLSPQLRQRILHTARQLGYSPDPLGRSLRTGRVGAVGVLYGERLGYSFSDPVASLFMQGLSSVLEEANLGVLLVPRRTVHNTLVNRAPVDGFVVYSLFEGDALVEQALARNLPTVLVDYPAIQGIPAVNVDDEGGARAAALHLQALGHQRVGVVALPFASGAVSGCNASDARLRGYQAVLGRLPLAQVQENLPSQGASQATALLQQTPRPTALLCMSDQLAIGALEAAEALGLRVPQDLSIVGFDGIPQAAGLALTTVHQPLLDKGRWAGQLLLAQLSGQKPSALAVLPTALVVRSTSSQAAN